MLVYRIKIIFAFLISLLYLHFAFLTVSFAHSQTQVIEMTEDGFVPSDVTVDTSSTVFFLNKDKTDHWPASNPHPTHNLYPEFDPQLPVASGKSWVFKPLKAGDWKYHDHLNPHRGGILRVMAETNTSSEPNVILGWIQGFKNTAQILFAKIYKSFEPKVILEKDKFVSASAPEQIIQLRKYADSGGAEKAWQFIKDTYRDQSGASGNIHDLSHLSGGLLFDQKGFEGLGKCSADFAFGCYHGFLDEAFKKDLDHLQEAEQACAKLGSGISGPVASCIHGIGHGVASFYAVADLKKSLSACRKLTSGSEYCFDGVLMEFVRSAPVLFFKQDDLLYPCDFLEKEFGYAYSSACGRNQSSLLMGRFKMNFEAVIPVCLGSNSTPFKNSCIDSLGFSLASSGDSEKIIQGCQMMGEDEYIKSCLRAAAGELVFQDVPGWDQKSKAVCAGFADNTSECLAYVNRLISDYHRVPK